MLDDLLSSFVAILVVIVSSSLLFFFSVQRKKFVIRAPRDVEGKIPRADRDGGDGSSSALLLENAAGKDAEPLKQQERGDGDDAQRRANDELKMMEDALMAQRMAEEEEEALRQLETDMRVAASLKFECPVCQEELDEDSKFIWGACEHVVCRECARDQVKHDYAEGRVPVRCPTCVCEGAKEPVTLLNDGLYVLLEPEEVEKCLDKEQDLICMENLTRCQTPDCRGMAELVEGNPHFTCPACLWQWCVVCKVKWHAGATCQEFGQWKTENDHAEELTLEMIETHPEYQRCPKCNNACERKDGCAKMKCLCGAFFCIRCGKDISVEGYNHFGGACKLFDYQEQE